MWLGVSARTVCLWAECGEIPALKIGRQWRFPVSELRQWLDSPQASKVKGQPSSNTSFPRATLNPVH